MEKEQLTDKSSEAVQGCGARRKKTPGRVFWLIPLQLVLSTLIILAGLGLDSLIWKNADSSGTGHPAPVVTVLALPLAAGLFIMVAVISVMVYVRRKRKYTAERNP